MAKKPVRIKAPQPVKMSHMCLCKYKGTLIRAAVATTDLCDFVVGLCEQSKSRLNGSSHEQIRNLMVERHNEPTDSIYSSARQFVNSKLAEQTFNGLHYYLVAGEGGYYQLWEVTPPEK